MGNQIIIPNVTIEPQEFDRGLHITFRPSHVEWTGRNDSLVLRGATMRNDPNSNRLTAMVRSTNGRDRENDRVYLAQVEFLPGKQVWMHAMLVYEKSLVFSCALQNEEAVEMDMTTKGYAPYVPRTPWRQDTFGVPAFPVVECDVMVRFDHA